MQRWLGHHAASFTLDTYIGLLNEELPEPDFFDQAHTGRTTGDAETAREADRPQEAETA